MSAGMPLHGGQLREIAERFGVAVEGLVDFSANINPEGPPGCVMEALEEGVRERRMLTEYPELTQRRLKEAIARYAGVGPGNVMVGNGFVPLLEATIRAMRVGRCVVPMPAFVEYRRTLERMGVGVRTCCVKAETGFAYDAAGMLEGDAEAVLLANPQNPSGAVSSAGWMLELVERAAAKKMLVLLDEAFVDYAPESSAVEALRGDGRVVIFRSVTKFFGMPGMRVAYALAAEETAARIEEQLPPWPVTTLASLAAEAALGDAGYVVETRARNEKRRAEMEGGMRGLPLKVYPGGANYVLFRVREACDAMQFWEQMIVRHGVVLRHCGNYEELGVGHFRAAVRTESENERLLEALTDVLGVGVAGPAEKAG